MNAHRFRRFIAVVGCLAFMVYGCSSKPVPTPAPQQAGAPVPKPTKLVVALQGEPASLDPQWDDDGNQRALMENVYEGLTQNNPKTGLPEPGLAENYKQNSATEWEFKLRSGVTFSTGKPLTAEDVVYSISRLVAADYAAPLRGAWFGTIAGAKKVDDKTVIVTSNAPDPTVPHRLARVMILEKQAFEAQSQGDPWAKKWASSQAVGTGPYKLVGWERGVSVTLQARDDYWGGKMAIKDVVFKFIKEAPTRLAAVQSGDVQLATGMPAEYAQKLPQLISATSPRYMYVQINRYRGLLKDPKLALAVEYAIDKKALVDLFGGYAKPAGMQLFGPSTYAYNEKDPGIPYDPEKAKALLKEAGYKGEEIEFLAPTGRYPADKEVAEAVGAMLQNVGFKVKMNVMGWAAFLVQFTREKGSDLGLNAHNVQFGNPDRTYSSYGSSKGQRSYYNTSVDELVDKARQETDFTKRADMYKQILDHFYIDPPWVSLVNYDNTYGASANLVWTPRSDEEIHVKEISFK